MTEKPDSASAPDSSPAPAATKTDWIRPVVFFILLLPLFAGGVLLAIFFNMRTLEKRRAESSPKTPEQISLEAENILLKKMLGQIEGRVAPLGPVENGAAAHGKIVWDEALQQGFLYAADLPGPLPPGKAFFLWSDSGDGKLQPCARLEPGPDGVIRRAFIPPQRVLKVEGFVLTTGDAQGQKNPREKRILEGRLEAR